MIPSRARFAMNATGGHSIGRASIASSLDDRGSAVVEPSNRATFAGFDAMPARLS
jgi:hypothetical protein